MCLVWGLYLIFFVVYEFGTRARVREAGTYWPSLGPECSNLIVAEVMGQSSTVDGLAIICLCIQSLGTVCSADEIRFRLQLVPIVCPMVAWIVHLALLHPGYPTFPVSFMKNAQVSALLHGREKHFPKSFLLYSAEQFFHYEFLY